jgi:hypothetical protein
MLGGRASRPTSKASMMASTTRRARRSRWKKEEEAPV